MNKVKIKDNVYQFTDEEWNLIFKYREKTNSDWILAPHGLNSEYVSFRWLTDCGSGGMRMEYHQKKLCEIKEELEL